MDDDKTLDEAMAEAIVNAIFREHTKTKKGPDRREHRAWLARRGVDSDGQRGKNPQPKLTECRKWTDRRRRTLQPTNYQQFPEPGVTSDEYARELRRLKNRARRMRQGRIKKRADGTPIH